MVYCSKKITSDNFFPLLQEKNHKNMDTKFSVYVYWCQSIELWCTVLMRYILYTLQQNRLFLECVSEAARIFFLMAIWMMDTRSKLNLSLCTRNYSLFMLVLKKQGPARGLKCSCGIFLWKNCSLLQSQSRWAISWSCWKCLWVQIKSAHLNLH